MLSLDRAMQVITRTKASLRMACETASAKELASSITGAWRLENLISNYLPPVTIDTIKVGNYSWKMELYKDDWIQRHIHFYGLWERPETSLLSRLLRAGSVFFDIGANVGYFTFMASKIVGPNGKVISCEPVKSTFNALTRNLNLNDSRNVITLPYAISNNSQQASIYYRPQHDSASNSLAKFEVDSGSETVNCITWDECLERFLPGTKVDMAKIDVEGSEFNVLKGAQNLLTSTEAPDLLIEIFPERLHANSSSASEVVELLLSYGYRIFSLRNGFGLAAYKEPTLKIENVFTTKKMGLEKVGNFSRKA